MPVDSELVPFADFVFQRKVYTHLSTAESEREAMKARSGGPRRQFDGSLNCSLVLNVFDCKAREFLCSFEPHSCKTVSPCSSNSQRQKVTPPFRIREKQLRDQPAVPHVVFVANAAPEQQLGTWKYLRSCSLLGKVTWEGGFGGVEMERRREDGIE